MPQFDALELNELIRELYSGYAKPQPWGGFLLQLRQMVRADSAAIILRHPKSLDRGIHFTSGIEVHDHLLTSYAQEAVDPFLFLDEGVIKTLDEMIPAERLPSHPFYLRYMEPLGCKQILGVDISNGVGGRAYLRVMRHTLTPKFGREEKELIKLVAPHLQVMIKELHNFHRLTQRFSLYENAMDGVAMATLLLDDELNLIYSNSVAKQLLTHSDGVEIFQGKLRATRSTDNRALQKRLTHCLQAQLAPHVETLTVERKVGLAPLHLVIKPIAGNTHKVIQKSAAVAVLVHTPEYRSTRQSDTLKELFGLTRQETRLCMALSNGLSLQEVADSLEISKNTAKVHLHNAFQKTGTGHQSALVSLILRSAAALC